MKLEMQLKVVVINASYSPAADFLCCLGNSGKGAALDTIGGTGRVLFAAGRMSLWPVRLRGPTKRWRSGTIPARKEKEFRAMKKELSKGRAKFYINTTKAEFSLTERFLSFNIHCFYLEGTWTLPIKIDKYMQGIVPVLILKGNYMFVNL